jgi:hypothetical protein
MLPKHSLQALVMESLTIFHASFINRDTRMSHAACVIAVASLLTWPSSGHEGSLRHDTDGATLASFCYLCRSMWHAGRAI